MVRTGGGPCTARDLATVFRLALEQSPPGRNWHAVADQAIPYRQIAEAIASRLKLPAVPIPADVLMLPGYFGFLANLVTLDTPSSSAINPPDAWLATHAARPVRRFGQRPLLPRWLS